MRRWMDDEHSEQYRSHQLRGVCGGTVQQRVHGGVRGVWGGIGDGGVEQDGGDIVHGVWCGSVQPCVDCSMHAVSCWFSHELRPGSWSVVMFCLCGGAVQQRIDGGVCVVWGWLDDGHIGSSRECDGVH